MNHIFCHYLKKFILVFFDDMLVYNPSLEQHLCHLRTTFQILMSNQLFVKKSKCTFTEGKVEYLGHIITGEGVTTDLKKITAMVEWPIPKTIKELKGFLGLTCYYRKFIRNYGVINKSLTELLRQNGFEWNAKAKVAFISLKKGL